MKPVYEYIEDPLAWAKARKLAGKSLPGVEVPPEPAPAPAPAPQRCPQILQSAGRAAARIAAEQDHLMSILKTGPMLTREIVSHPANTLPPDRTYARLHSMHRSDMLLACYTRDGDAVPKATQWSLP